MRRQLRFLMNLSMLLQIRSDEFLWEPRHVTFPSHFLSFSMSNVLQFERDRERESFSSFWFWESVSVCFLVLVLYFLAESMWSLQPRIGSDGGYKTYGIRERALNPRHGFIPPSRGHPGPGVHVLLFLYNLPAKTTIKGSWTKIFKQKILQRSSPSWRDYSGSWICDH